MNLVVNAMGALVLLCVTESPTRGQQPVPSLGGGDATLRIQAFATLRSGSPVSNELLRELMHAIEDANPRIVEAALDAVTRLGPKARVCSVAVVPSTLDADLSPRRIEALRALGPTGEALWLSRLVEPDEVSARMAVRTIGELGPAGANAVDALRLAALLYPSCAQVVPWSLAKIAGLDAPKLGRWSPTNAKAARVELRELLARRRDLQTEIAALLASTLPIERELGLRLSMSFAGAATTSATDRLFAALSDPDPSVQAEAWRILNTSLHLIDSRSVTRHRGSADRRERIRAGVVWHRSIQGQRLPTCLAREALLDPMLDVQRAGIESIADTGIPAEIAVLAHYLERCSPAALDIAVRAFCEAIPRADLTSVSSMRDALGGIVQTRAVDTDARGLSDLRSLLAQKRPSRTAQPPAADPKAATEVDRIRGLLGRASADEQLRLLTELYELGDAANAAAPDLILLAENCSPNTARKVKAVLAQMDSLGIPALETLHRRGIDTREQLLSALNGADRRARDASLQSVINLGLQGPDVIDIVASLSQSPFRDRRRSGALLAFALMDVESNVSAVLGSVLGAEDPSLRARALMRLAERPELAKQATPTVIECLLDEDRSVREAAVTLLGKLFKTEPALAPLLAEATGDPDPRVAATALAALGTLNK